MLALLLFAPSAGGLDAWSIEFLASATAHYDGLVVGVQPGATDSYDTGVDRPEPPPPPGDSWVQLYARTEAIRPEFGRLDRSFMDESPRHEWTIVLHTPTPGTRVRLEWAATEAPDRVFEIDLQEEIVDLRTRSSIEIVCEETRCEIPLHSYALVGEAPSEPRNLTALPGILDGNVTLAWSPPDSDGGLPLRGFAVWRSLPGETWALAGRTRSHGFTDQGREAGEVWTYHVRAENAWGSSTPSNVAVAPGTARERTLAPGSDPATWTALASAQADPRSTASELPDVFALDGRPARDDPRTYELAVRVGEEERSAGVFAAGLVQDPLRLDRDTAASIAPPGRASASLWTTADGDIILLVETGGSIPHRREAFLLAP